jgi:hypothetical protein
VLSRKTAIATACAAGLFIAAALTLDVDIRWKDAWAAPATPASG